MNKKTIIACMVWISVSSCWANIRVPKLISDGMILQRNATVVIWGWAEVDETVKLSFQSQNYTTKTDKKGNWKLQLSNLNVGGPYTMELKGNNQILINNILVGDVWVCSGQSNMELPMERVRFKYEKEIALARNSNIRQFTVPQKYNFKTPQEDLESGQWQELTHETVLNFSATAYFFAKELYNKENIPIGLIHTSLGGSPAEAWMSEEALKQFPNHYAEAQRFKDDDLIHEIEKSDHERIEAWYTLAKQKDIGYLNTHWGKTPAVADSWAAMNVPGYWTDTPLGHTNGVVWFQKDFNVPHSWIGQKSQLNLGAIVDADSVWINGTFIGNTTYMYPPRWYRVPENLFKEGHNTIVIRVANERGQGGFVPDKAYEIVANHDTIDLSGSWKYKLGTVMEQLDPQTFIRWKPAGLYNAMLAPLLNYRIKGVIWYQGESNIGRAKEYQTLFPALIRNWRTDWKQGDFPFLFVQLSSFMKPSQKPTESYWAMLREAQLKTLSESNTGIAVTIDIGEWNDVHPLNKEDVGKRLALAARHVAYKDAKTVYSGPIYKSMVQKGKSIILTFDHIGTGLQSKNGALMTFAIAGADKKFVWATAVIKGNRVIVSSEAISQPVAVRYAWADNPQGANLYNKAGLPASPFRTDDW